MAVNMESLVGGLKKGVARGYGLMEYFEVKSEVYEAMLVKSWTLVSKASAVEEMAWALVAQQRTYGSVPSHCLGVMSHIETKLKAKAYTNKKGVKHEDKWEDAHYTKAGTFLDWVSKLGKEPVSYPMNVEITETNFRFKLNPKAKCVADFFVFDEGTVVDTEAVKARDRPKKSYKAERKAVCADWDAEAKVAKAKAKVEEELDEAYEYSEAEED
jgi:hypothetical protein